MHPAESDSAMPCDHDLQISLSEPVHCVQNLQIWPSDSAAECGSVAVPCIQNLEIWPYDCAAECDSAAVVLVMSAAVPANASAVEMELPSDPAVFGVR